MFPAIAAFAVVAGTAIGIKGDLDAAAAESDAARRDASLKRLQAKETEKRAQMNMEITDEEGDVIEGEMQSAYAKGGVDVGSGSPLIALAEQGYRTRREMANIYSEAKFRADMLRAGADDSDRWASNNDSAATTRAIGSALKMVGSMGMNGAFSGKAGGGGGGTITGGSGGGGRGGMNMRQAAY